ncbi:Na/Pi cotransporter family protein [Tannockella kyphosi]|uniref:Na/Pi cotransporter family protein n=1 Tax=Tannockella kyphosi TaxID=2899121 RepID=UPI00201269B8|nr:Na/Pi cotransporter family protein [Tannockella kyphosi]
MTLADIDWPLILAGLGLFLFGIEYMGEGLKNFSGDKLKDIIDKYTSSPIKGILIGALVTCLIQSSSGTTALTIGLIRSGLMTLTQGVGIIMGANIGTTITAFLIGLDIAEYSVYFISAGACLLLFFSSKKMKYLGQILFGFGCLFYGLELMGDNLKIISQVEEFQAATVYLAQNPLLGLVGGIVLTMIIQSSSAVIAIVQQMYGVGAITLGIALPFTFGSNIGTTITAILASFGGSVPSKRAAAFHTLFNVLGTVFFMLLLIPFQSMIEYINGLLNLTPEMELALAHGIFNVSTTILLFPFIGKMVTLVKKIIPSNAQEYEMDLSELDPHVVQIFPSHALEIAKTKTVEMGKVTKDCVLSTKKYFVAKSNNDRSYALEMENAINLLDDRITHYLVLISSETLNDSDALTYLSNMKAIKDLERIGDLSMNILKYFEAVFDERDDFSPEAREDVIRMLDMVLVMLEKTMIAFENSDSKVRDEVDELENELDYLTKKAKQRHIQRVITKVEKSPLVNSTYVDIISNLERMGDHCQNIAEYYSSTDEIVHHPEIQAQ